MENDVAGGQEFWTLNVAAGWWFGTFFIVPYIGNNQIDFHIFQRGGLTTNQAA